MKVNLPYGKNEYVEIDIPNKNLIGVYEADEGSPIKNESEVIAETLDNPLGTLPITELARGKKNAVIAITDASRPNLERKVLPLLIERLVEAGIKKKDITVMIGPGSHRPAYDEEVEEMLGELKSKVEVVCHNAFDSETVDLGKSSFGYDLKINKHFYEKDLKIILGIVLPHPFAGFSGGGKMVSVGINSAEAISSSHSPETIDHHNTGFGITEDNPFFIASREMAKMADVDFLVNGVMDEKENLIFVQAGSVEKAHQKCIDKNRELFEVEIPEKVDILIVSTGYPKDNNLYHVCALGVCAVAGSAVKYPCLEEGGTMIMVSPMEDGCYNEVFYETLKESEEPSDVIRRVENLIKREPGHHRAYGVAQVLEKYRVVMAGSKLDKNCIENAHIETSPSAMTALNEAFEKYGEDAKVAVILYSHRMILKCTKN